MAATLKQGIQSFWEPAPTSYVLYPEHGSLTYLPHLTHSAKSSPPKSLPLKSTNRIIKVESTPGVILLLQSPQSLQPPRLIPIQHLRRLISRRIIDIRVKRPPWRIARVKQSSSLVAIIIRHSCQGTFAGRPKERVGALINGLVSEVQGISKGEERTQVSYLLDARTLYYPDQPPAPPPERILRIGQWSCSWQGIC